MTPNTSKITQPRTADRLAALICALFIALTLAYAAVTPPFEASDEAAHFLYVHHLLAQRDLPRITDRETLSESPDAVARWSIESHQPPLYYALGALLVSPTRRGDGGVEDDVEAYLRPNELIFIRAIVENNHNQWLHDPNPPTGDTHLALWGLRLFSLILSTTTLVLIYRTGRLIFAPAVALTAMLLVALTPTYIAIGGSINNDNLVTLLYTAGVYMSVRVWHMGRITRRDTLILSAILAAIALTKITGLGLFAIVYGVLALGVLTRRFTLRAVAGTVAVSLGVTALFAGWWYVRNTTLYGDPLAMAATRALWGREYAVASESGDVLAEISRVWRSFWMMIGHLHHPVWGPKWLYGWAAVASGVGILGGLRMYLTPQPSLQPGEGGQKSPLSAAERGFRGEVLILLLAALLPIALLAVGTLSIDISYGRLLFPGLVGFAPLLAWGWWRLLGRFAPLLLIPLAMAALLAPIRDIVDAYPRLEIVAAIPASAVPVNVRADGLTILAYEPLTDQTIPGGDTRYDVYLTGANAQNPALFATLLDPLTGEALGKAALYPGMAPTDSLQPDTLYRAPLRVRVDDILKALSPRLLRLQLGWQTMLSTDYLPMTITDGTTVNALVLNAATLIDGRFIPQPYRTSSDLMFHDADGREVIRLVGYDLSDSTIAPGESLDLKLIWRYAGDVSHDYVVTTQLIDSLTGALLAQDDGDIPGYPTSAWRPGADVDDQRQLTVESCASRQEHRLMIGWYRQDADGNFIHLQPSASDAAPLANIAALICR